MNSTFMIYRRLLGFAKPYSAYLTIGILAGMLSGGSLFGVLSFLPHAISPFGQEQAQVAQPSQSAQPTSPVQTAAVPEDEAQRRVEKVRYYAAKLGIEAYKPDGSMTWQFMLLAIIGLPFFMLLKGVSTFVNRFFMRWVGARVVMDLRNTLFAHLQNQSLKFFGTSDVGHLISRCTSDTAAIEHAVATAIADLTRAPIEVLAAAGFIIVYAYQQSIMALVVAIFLVFPLCIVPLMLLGRYIRRYSKSALRRISDLVSRMQENFTGIRVVKAFHMEAKEVERFREMNLRYFKMIIRALRAELFLTPVMELVVSACLCGFLIYCYSRGIDFKIIIPMAAAAVVAYKPVKQIAKLNVNLQRSVAAAERIFDILDQDTSLPMAANPVVVPEFRHAIQLDHVTFAYGAGANTVLDDVSLTVPRGSVAAFVGETGAGKSTIVNLVARFYDPVAGRILLDGVDLKEMDITSLRKLIGIVTQETILFNDTIAANIAYGTEGASQEQIVEAAKQANAHEFIMADPAGYDRVVGEKGFVLSGGQRQRLAIARAILKNPPILILDEATSALDTVTEQLVQQAIARVMEHRTVFAVAHRLSTVKHADQICVLAAGRIKECGTHDQLFARNGLYRKLCDMQLS